MYFPPKSYTIGVFNSFAFPLTIKCEYFTCHYNFRWLLCSIFIDGS